MSFFKNLPYRRARRSLRRVRREMDALVRSAEDLQMRLHEHPPGRHHTPNELTELFEEFERIRNAQQRIADALQRGSAGLMTWSRFALPTEMRAETDSEVPLRWGPDNPQPASPYSDAGTVVEPRAISVEDVLKDGEDERRRRRRAKASASSSQRRRPEDRSPGSPPPDGT